MKYKISLLFTCLFFVSVIFVRAQIPDGYYDSAAGLSGPELKAALHNIIKNHHYLSYDSVTIALRVVDEDTNNTNNVICLYTGWSYPKNAFGNGSSEWNREHTWSKSHGDFGESPPEGTDLYHLRPADASVNSAKNNRDFSTGIIEYLDSGVYHTDCYEATDIWEPRDEVKGDVARSMFYMATRYEGENGETDLELVNYSFSSPNKEPLYGILDTLLKWAEQDPVSNWERRRNDIVYSTYQHNRNPFIDHPEYIEEIWGTPEPADYPTGFSGNTITLTWTDANTGVLPDAYLVERSTAGYDAMPVPVDGVGESNSADVKNITFGVGRCVFGNCIPGTTYYFKIYPYKGNDNTINYKTDGEIQELTIQYN